MLKVVSSDEIGGVIGYKMGFVLEVVFIAQLLHMKLLGQYQQEQ